MANEIFNEDRNVMNSDIDREAALKNSDIDHGAALNSYLHERKTVHYKVLKKESDYMVYLGQ